MPFPSQTVSAALPKFVHIMGVEVSSASALRFRLLFYGLFFFVGVLMLTSACLLYQKMGTSTSSETPDRGANNGKDLPE